jgi:prepilin signal peptidase PulO-like enzyme (type II secretory pathway)
MLFLLFIFVCGLAIGSFLNVLIDRSITGEAIWKGRSHCDHCKHKLHWNDLVPLISFILLRGKCRYCHKKLSFYYPLVELVTGAIFVLTVSLIGQASSMYQVVSIKYTIEMVYYLFLVSSLIALFFTDLKYGILPFSIVFSGIFVSIVYLLFNDIHLIPNALLSGVGAYAFFLLIFFGTLFFTKKEGMGFGDVVYAFFMGLILGFPKIVLGLYIAFVVGALIALILVILGKKKFKGGSIPFGPFLIFGTFVSLFWGQVLIEKIMFFLIR